MKLSEHFTLSEFTRSQYAGRRGLPNMPAADSVRNLHRLCIYVLEPLRALAGNVPINISSGYRSVAVNTGVGGAEHSYHLLGCAADIWSDHHTPGQLARIVVDSGLAYDELYVEFGQWLHIAVPLTAHIVPKYERGTILTRDGMRVTLAGIHSIDAQGES